MPFRISLRHPLVMSLLALTGVVLALLLAAEPGASSAGAVRADGDREQERLARAADVVQRGLRGCTNQRRIRHGLPTLEPAQPLEQAASLHASSMSKKNFFSHVDPSGRDAADRVGIFASKSRFKPIGENLAGGFGSAEQACKQWMDSPAHRAAILNPDYTVIGAGFAKGGVYGSYFVQVFGRDK